MLKIYHDEQKGCSSTEMQLNSARFCGCKLPYEHHDKYRLVSMDSIQLKQNLAGAGAAKQHQIHTHQKHAGTE